MLREENAGSVILNASPDGAKLEAKVGAKVGAKVAPKPEPEPDEVEPEPLEEPEPEPQATAITAAHRRSVFPSIPGEVERWPSKKLLEGKKLLPGRIRFWSFKQIRVT